MIKSVKKTNTIFTIILIAFSVFFCNNTQAQGLKDLLSQDQI